MSYSPYSIEERFSIITDCLQSGLTINMWCCEHDIPTGIFYSWISQVKKSGYQVNLSKRNKTVISPNPRQEVVRENLVKEETEIYNHPAIQSREVYISQESKILTLKFRDCSLEIPAGTDMTLLLQVIRTMRCIS